MAIFHFGFNGLQVDRPLDNLVIIGCLRNLDRIMENVAIAMLRYLSMQHANDILKSFKGDLSLRFVAPPPSPDRSWAGT